ncbi:hypothetical protein GCM10010492_02040 [Saccharothrix mutabilis subsp. mutabilis]|uniref:Uncharacterized protein n=1 Tax=Saccharothrix mutabilis subsp. mutabilis TaxID=66855 RepID=A0ABP3CLF5_9PSEU
MPAGRVFTWAQLPQESYGVDGFITERTVEPALLILTAPTGGGRPGVDLSSAAATRVGAGDRSARVDGPARGEVGLVDDPHDLAQADAGVLRLCAFRLRLPA